MDAFYVAEAMKQLPRLGSINSEQRKQMLYNIIMRLYALKNARVDQQAMHQEVSYAVEEVDRDLRIKYPFFTMTEVALALEAGVKGEFIDDKTPAAYQSTALNAANYCRWLSLYRNSAVRLEALQDVENGKRLTEPQNLLSAGDIESRNIAAFDKLEKDIRGTMKDGTIPAEFSDMICAKLYNHLRTHGRMDMPTQAAIDAAQDVARKFLKTELQVNCRAKRSLLEMYLGRSEDLPAN